MAVFTNLTVIACDACGASVQVNKGIKEVYPHFSGTAVDGSCGLKVKWHACSREHIGDAVLGAIKAEVSTWKNM